MLARSFLLSPFSRNLLPYTSNTAISLFKIQLQISVRKKKIPHRNKSLLGKKNKNKNLINLFTYCAKMKLKLNFPRGFFIHLYFLILLSILTLTSHIYLSCLGYYTRHCIKSSKREKKNKKPIKPHKNKLSPTFWKRVTWTADLRAQTQYRTSLHKKNNSPPPLKLKRGGASHKYTRWM